MTGTAKRLLGTQFHGVDEWASIPYVLVLSAKLKSNRIDHKEVLLCGA